MDVGERLRQDVPITPDRPVWRDAPDDVAGEAVSVRRALDDLVISIKAVVVEVEERPKLELPVLRHAVDIHTVARVEGPLLGLEICAAVPVHLDCPIVPWIVFGLRLLACVLLRRSDVDPQSVPHRRLHQVRHEGRSERAKESISCLGLRRVHVDGVKRREVHPLERTQADEVERLRLATRARVLSGHEDVDTGDLAVADVVHIGKLLSDEGFVAEIAVQEDGKPCERFRLDVLRRRRLGGRSDHHKDSKPGDRCGRPFQYRFYSSSFRCLFSIRH